MSAIMMVKSVCGNAQGVGLPVHRQAALRHGREGLNKLSGHHGVSRAWTCSWLVSPMKHASRRLRGNERRRLKTRLAPPATMDIASGDCWPFGRPVLIRVRPSRRSKAIIVIIPLRDSLENHVQKFAPEFVAVQKLINASFSGKNEKAQAVDGYDSLRERFSNELLLQICVPPSVFGDAYLSLWFTQSGFQKTSSSQELLTGFKELKGTADQQLRKQIELIAACVFGTVEEAFQQRNWFLNRLTMMFGGSVRLMSASMLQDICLDENLRRAACEKRKTIERLAPNFGASPFKLAISMCWLNPACPLALMTDEAAAEVVQRLLSAFGFRIPPPGRPDEALRSHRRRLGLEMDRPRTITRLIWCDKLTKNDLRIREFVFARRHGWRDTPQRAGAAHVGTSKCDGQRRAKIVTP